jgi:hypothetical protein
MCGRARCTLRVDAVASACGFQAPLRSINSNRLVVPPPPLPPSCFGLEVLERRCRFLVRWILVSFFDLSLSLCSTPAPFFLTLELCRGIMNSWCMCGILHGFQYFFYFLFCGIPVIG